MNPNMHIVELLPLWVTFLAIVLLIVASVRAGMFLAYLRRGHMEDDGALNTIVGSTLGLLAFILAFMFGLTANRFDARKEFLREEVNTIHTTWYRAGLLPDPYPTQIRELLTHYVGIRIDLTKHPNEVEEHIRQSENVQEQIWSIIESAVRLPENQGEIMSQFISSVNEMFENQTRRIAVGRDRIPEAIWLALFGLIIFSMLEVGYLLSKTKHINWGLITTLAIAFAAIILIVVDLDTAGGIITLNMDLMDDLYEKISVH